MQVQTTWKHNLSHIRIAKILSLIHAMVVTAWRGSILPPCWWSVDGPHLQGRQHAVWMDVHVLFAAAILL